MSSGVHSTAAPLDPGPGRNRRVRDCSLAQETTVWIGDSHSRFNLARPDLDARLTRASESNFVWSIGPRLMYSIARRGWPADVSLGSRLLQRQGPRPRFASASSSERSTCESSSVTARKSTALDLSFVPAYATEM